MTRLDDARAYDEAAQADLHRGLDRELDLWAERPAVVGPQRSRGPGLLVAVIVVSSLSLAGMITLLRGDGSEPSTHEPTEPLMGVEVFADDPRESTPIGAPTEVAPVVPPHPALATVVLPEHTPLPGPSIRPETSEKPEQATPAPTTARSPRTSRSLARSSPTRAPFERPSGASVEHEHRLRLPAPMFDDPAPIEPAQAALPHIEPRPLPEVDVLSLFETPEPLELEPSAPSAPPVAPSVGPSTGATGPVALPSEQDALRPSGSAEPPAPQSTTSVEDPDPPAAGAVPSGRPVPPSAGY
ncbi:MAG: hypothetical protein AAGF11_05865 [Myxococcota bacterium]